MAMNWGSVTKPTGRDHREICEPDGGVTQPTPSSLTASPRHVVHYDATDSRHNLETGNRPWTSVDHMSGPTSHETFEDVHGNFPDGPGAWRQT